MLIRVRQNNTNFEFQGRTTLAANSNATIFSAFALRDDDRIEVCTSKMLLPEK